MYDELKYAIWKRRKNELQHIYIFKYFPFKWLRYFPELARFIIMQYCRAVFMSHFWSTCKLINNDRKILFRIFSITHNFYRSAGLVFSPKFQNLSNEKAYQQTTNFIYGIAIIDPLENEISITLENVIAHKTVKHWSETQVQRVISFLLFDMCI